MHTIRYCLLSSHLIHSAFQCLESFRQLLAIHAQLLTKGTIILISRTPLRLQLCNPGQQLRLSLLCLLSECKNLLLEDHQTLSSFHISTS